MVFKSPAGVAAAGAAAGLTGGRHSAAAAAVPIARGAPPAGGRWYVDRVVELGFLRKGNIASPDTLRSLGNRSLDALEQKPEAKRDLSNCGHQNQ